jgi:hypothetical protein
MHFVHGIPNMTTMDYLFMSAQVTWKLKKTICKTVFVYSVFVRFIKWFLKQPGQVIPGLQDMQE